MLQCHMWRSFHSWSAEQFLSQKLIHDPFVQNVLLSARFFPSWNSLLYRLRKVLNVRNSSPYRRVSMINPLTGDEPSRSFFIWSLTCGLISTAQTMTCGLWSECYPDLPANRIGKTAAVLKRSQYFHMFMLNSGYTVQPLLKKEIPICREVRVLKKTHLYRQFCHAVSENRHQDPPFYGKKIAGKTKCRNWVGISGVWPLRFWSRPEKISTLKIWVQAWSTSRHFWNFRQYHEGWRPPWIAPGSWRYHPIGGSISQVS
jgi:hypothetical protein